DDGGENHKRNKCHDFLVRYLINLMPILQSNCVGAHTEGQPPRRAPPLDGGRHRLYRVPVSAASGDLFAVVHAKIEIPSGTRLYRNDAVEIDQPGPMHPPDAERLKPGFLAG